MTLEIEIEMIHEKLIKIANKHFEKWYIQNIPRASKELNCIVDFKDRYKVNVESIIETGASKCYISPDLIPSNYMESALYKVEVKDDFSKITIL